MKKTKDIALILGVLVISLAIAYLATAWTEPSQTPPLENVPAPLNAGVVGQSKEGPLIVGTNQDAVDSYGFGLIVYHGNVQADKLTVNVIDPVFEIDGQKYATYVSDFAGGLRIETAGSVLVDGQYVIDFNDLEEGSDVWLFWKASNKKIDDLVVNLTCGFSGSAWYEKKENSLIIKTNQRGEVSYRLSLPRFDHLKWPNLIEDGTVKGIKVSE